MRVRTCLTRIAFGILSLAVLFAVFLYFFAILPYWGIPFNASRRTRPPITPPWALECWLWEDDVNTEAFVNELLDGYAQNDIPVRTLLIDSPWSTRYNDFTVDEARYPNPGEFFKGLQDKGIRVVLWMTCNVNKESDDTPIQDSQDWFEEAKSKGYLINNGENWNEGEWWKGKGGYIDYTNPEAMTWWQSMQQPLFDWGIDGWKLDGSDAMCFGPLGRLPRAYMRCHKGWITTRGYMDHYSRVEYSHGLTQNPEFVVMVRSYDTPWAHPEGFSPRDSAPLTWIGDRHHAWQSAEQEGDSGPDKDLMMKDAGEGIEAALRDILLSSKKGYCVVGDDIAGYHGGPEIPPRLYIRWAQFGAFTGFFLNGGHGERRLWMRSQDELEIIRTFSWLHTELVPYMYSHVVRCHEGGPSLIRPVPGRYHYLFGDDFLVAPVYRDSLENTVTLPAGPWRYLFQEREVISGPLTFTREFPLDEFPVFVRDGAIIPMQVSRDYTGFGCKDSEGFITWAIYPFGPNAFTLHNTDGSGTTTVQVIAKGKDIEIAFSGTQKPHILRILVPTKPILVELDGSSLAESVNWSYDENEQRLWMKTPSYEGGQYRIVLP